MNKLRKQIRESFFNPVLHLFPILIFLIIDELFGMNIAWKVSFPVAIALLIYVFYVYNRIFTWHLIFTSVFLVITIIAGVEYLFPITADIHQILYEIVVICFLIIFLSFRNQIEKISSSVISRLTPMTNNFEEMYRFSYILFLVLLFYVSANTLIRFKHGTNVMYQLQISQYIYICVLSFLIFYEGLRVKIVRADLLNEEWWPIVNDNGKIIGSIQHLTSLHDEKKYKHPIVRVVLIEDGMILLQKRSAENVVFPGKWDSTLSNHVIMEETVDQSIERTVKQRYGVENFKYVYLANYTLEVSNEYHYAFLFVSHQHIDLKPNAKYIDCMKWWTQQQIEQNLNAGIFTDNFIVEYDLIKRSGLLDSGKCECDCRLKDTIYKSQKK
jgi:isopentenyldiphosphate isomerase